MRKIFLFVLFCLLCACSRTPPGCDQMYVLLPDNYMIDLAAGAKVFLDPSSQEFALFCSAAKAMDALQKAGSSGDWRVYGVDGDFNEIVRELGAGKYILKRSANLTGWVDVQ